MRLIGVVVYLSCCTLHHRSSWPLDGHNIPCTISSCKSAAISKIVKRCCSRVYSCKQRYSKYSDLYLFSRVRPVGLMLQCCVCRRCQCIVAKRCALEQKVLLTSYRKSHYRKSIDTKMNDLDLCLEVVSRSCQPWRYIRRWISRKPLEIEGPPAGNGIWAIKWLHDRWRHVPPKVLWGSIVGYHSNSLASSSSHTFQPTFGNGGATFAKHCREFSSIAGLPCHLVVFGGWLAVVCGCRVESLKSLASVKALVDSDLQNAVWYKPGLQR